jgi:hypothetical protein
MLYTCPALTPDRPEKRQVNMSDTTNNAADKPKRTLLTGFDSFDSVAKNHTPKYLNTYLYCHSIDNEHLSKGFLPRCPLMEQIYKDTAVSDIFYPPNFPKRIQAKSHSEYKLAAIGQLISYLNWWVKEKVEPERPVFWFYAYSHSPCQRRVAFVNRALNDLITEFNFSHHTAIVEELKKLANNLNTQAIEWDDYARIRQQSEYWIDPSRLNPVTVKGVAAAMLYKLRHIGSLVREENQKKSNANEMEQIGISANKLKVKDVGTLLKLFQQLEKASKTELPSKNDSLRKRCKKEAEKELLKKLREQESHFINRPLTQKNIYTHARQVDYDREPSEKDIREIISAGAEKIYQERDKTYAMALDKRRKSIQAIVRKIDHTHYPIKEQLLQFDRAKGSLLEADWRQIRDEFSVDAIMQFQKNGLIDRAIDALEPIKGVLKRQQPVGSKKTDKIRKPVIAKQVKELFEFNPGQVQFNGNDLGLGGMAVILLKKFFDKWGQTVTRTEIGEDVDLSLNPSSYGHTVTRIRKAFTKKGVLCEIAPVTGEGWVLREKAKPKTKPKGTKNKKARQKHHS